MIKVSDRSLCCGCTACQAVCPHGAVSMVPDALGFMYPSVDMDRCTDCGLCEKVCGFVRTLAEPSSRPETVPVVAARNRDAAVLRESQSGGVFTALAKVVLSRSGVVYGSAMNPDFSVSHRRAETIEECAALRGSKYAQSDMGDVFVLVRKDLEDGREVLFTGTPCQVAGLVAYLPKRLTDKLLTVDIICHGVPSPKVWADYVAYMGRKGELSSAVFRDKGAEGWKVHKESFEYKDGRKVFRETFRVLFYKNIMLRRSCASCPYDYSRRKSDITIADFWGVEEILPHFDGNNGTSMVIPMSAKGHAALEAASVDLDMEHATVGADFVSRRNPNLLRPTKPYHESDMFERLYSERGFVYAARRWGDMGWRYKAWQMKVFFRKLFGKK